MILTRETKRCASDACSQGRMKCPTPYSCYVSEEDDLGYGLVLFLIVCICAMLAFALVAS